VVFRNVAKRSRITVLKQIDFERYREDGFLVVRNAFDPSLVRKWLAAWQKLDADITRGASPLKRSARFVSGTLPPPLGEVHAHGVLKAIANQLLGPDVALYMSRLLVKDSQWNGSVATHQDFPYFSGGSYKLSVFVPLTDCRQEHGALKFIAGSHKLGNLGVRGTIEHEKFPELRVDAPDLAVGDVLLADFLVWHYSEEATVLTERPLMQIVYQPAHDGSYYGMPDAPSLVSGDWRTKQFVRFGDRIRPDGQ
jgi:Phytanoyl-CoA dioxygenase (PhyH)